MRRTTKCLIRCPRGFWIVHTIAAAAVTATAIVRALLLTFRICALVGSQCIVASRMATKLEVSNWLKNHVQCAYIKNQAMEAGDVVAAIVAIAVQTVPTSAVKVAVALLVVATLPLDAVIADLVVVCNDPNIDEHC